MRGGILSVVAKDADEPISKTQLDKLGDRLRAGTDDEADLRALDEYRRSFRAAYDEVVAAVRLAVGMEGTGRPAKTTGAIVDKLRRQPIRLTQIQDIAGLRLVVGRISEQDRFIDLLRPRLSQVAIDDRRQKPSHGYRAVHLVVSAKNRLVEIQVRTREQHLWAEISEKLSDVVDPALKYGGGPNESRELLLEYSAMVADVERAELDVASAAARQAARDLELEQLRLSKPALSNQAELEAAAARAKSSYEKYRASVRQQKEAVGNLLLAHYNLLRRTPE